MAASFAYPTPTELRAGILTAIRYTFAKFGHPEPNLLEGSDHWIRADVYARQAAIAIANNKLALRDSSPLTATGDDLVTLAGLYGVVERPASSASGYVQCFGTAGAVVAIPASFQATAPNGSKYQTTSANTITLSGLTPVASTPTIEVRAVKAGTATNQTAGTKLTWDSAAIGALLNTCTADAGEIDGGAEADSEEVLRTRLLRRLANPSFGGNAAQVAEWAEASTAAVETAYVYPGVRGAGSYDVAVTAAGGDRILSDANVAVADAYIKGQQSGFADVNTTPTATNPLDVVVNLTLPLPIGAGGAGGGWKDAAPWPTTADSAAGAGIPVSVTAVAGVTLTVNATSSDPPVVGKRFALWHPGDQEFREFEIVQVTGGSGAYVIRIPGTVASVLSWVTTGQYVSAAATSLTTYGADFLEAMNTLGPGEKTASTDLLPRARRHPRVDTSNPSDLTEIQLGLVITAHPEMSGISYAARYDNGTTVTRTSPAIPTTTADPPKIITLADLAFRKGP